MAESWDFTIGAILGVVLTILATLLTSYLTEKRQTNKERKRAVSALLRELGWIRSKLESRRLSEIARIQTPIFEALISKISLFDQQTVYHVLDIYGEIHWSLRPNCALSLDNIDGLKKDIEIAMNVIEIELQW
jgi:hypothetical protein